MQPSRGFPALAPTGDFYLPLSEGKNWRGPARSDQQADQQLIGRGAKLLVLGTALRRAVPGWEVWHIGYLYRGLLGAGG